MLPSAFDKYRVTRLLGQGGMATVYEAHDPLLDRRVAIKVIHPHLAAEGSFAERFRQEARLVASLRHPHIIQLHEFDVHEGQHYMVMEYLDGGTLKDRILQLRAGGQLIGLGQIASLLDDLADALDYAHERGAVHRDIKPANVLFTNQREPVIGDFGIAKILSEAAQFSATGAMIGTPAYMSPEQASGSEVDGRSDIYSLGVMVYELATGRTPFTGDSPTAIIMQHLTSAPKNPRAYNPNLPEPVEKAILKAIAKQPDQRYATAGAFAKAFRAAMVGEASSSPEVGEGATEAFQTPAPRSEFQEEQTEPHAARGLQPSINDTPAGRQAAPPQAHASQDSRHDTRPSWRLKISSWILRLGAAALVLIAAMAGYTWWSAGRSEPISAVPGTFTIVVADFDGTNAGSQIDFARRIYEQLESDLVEFQGDVQLVRTNTVVPDVAAARQELAERGALALIWGWYDDAGVSPHVELAGAVTASVTQDPLITTVLAAGNPLSGPDAIAVQSFSQQIRSPRILAGLEYFVGNGPEQMAYIAASVLGLAFQSRGDLDKALSLYDRALENAPAAPETTGDSLGLDFVYFYRALAFAELERLPEAVASLEQAVAVNPGLFEAQFNLAVFYPEICSPLRPLDKALQAAQAAVTLNPDDPAARALLGSLYSQSHHLEAAITEVQAAEALAPNDPDILHLLGDIYQAAGQTDLAQQSWNRAVAALESALQANPDTANPFLVLGDLYLKLGRPDKAVESYQTALDISPESAGAQIGLGNVFAWQGDYDRASESYALSVELAPQNATAQLLLGIAAARLGEDAAALESYAESARRAPCDPTPHMLAGGIYVGQEDYATAEKEFEAAAEMDPANPDVHYLLGAALYFQDKLDEALTPIRTALELAPEEAAARNLLASILYRQGEFAQAAAEWLQLTQMEPAEAEYFTFLGNAYEQQGLWDEAIAAYLQSLSLRDNADVRVYLGLIYHQQGDLEAAQEQYEAASAVDPGSALALSGLGDVLADLGELVDAADAYSRALSIEETALLHAQLGAVRARQADLPAAIAEHERALELDPEYPLYYLLLAMLYTWNGQLADAEDAYNNLLSLSPSDPRAYSGLGGLAYQRCDLSGMSGAYAQAAASAPQNPLYLALSAIADEARDLDTNAAEAFLQLEEAAADGDPFSAILAGEYALRNNQLDKAAILFQQAIEAQGLSPFLLTLLHYDLGSVYFLQDRGAPAENEFLAALQVSPFFADAHVALGDLALLQGSLEEAIGEYGKALDILPEYGWQFSGSSAKLLAPAIHARFGVVFTRLSDVDRAAEAFSEALTLTQELLEPAPDWAQARFVLGFVYSALGDAASAEAEFSAALACDRSLETAVRRAEALLFP